MENYTSERLLKMAALVAHAPSISDRMNRPKAPRHTTSTPGHNVKLQPVKRTGLNAVRTTPGVPEASWEKRKEHAALSPSERLPNAVRTTPGVPEASWEKRKEHAALSPSERRKKEAKPFYFNTGYLSQKYPGGMTHFGIDGLTTGINAGQAWYEKNINSGCWPVMDRPNFTYQQVYDNAVGKDGAFSTKYPDMGEGVCFTNRKSKPSKQSWDDALCYKPGYNDFNYGKDEYLPVYSDPTPRFDTPYYSPYSHVSAPNMKNEVIRGLRSGAVDNEAASNWVKYLSPHEGGMLKGSASHPAFNGVGASTRSIKLHELNHAFHDSPGIQVYDDGSCSPPYGHEYDPYTGIPVEVAQGAAISNMAYDAFRNAYEKNPYDPAFIGGTKAAEAYHLYGDDTRQGIQARDRWLLQNPGFVLKHMGTEPYRYYSGMQNTMKIDKAISPYRDFLGKHFGINPQDLSNYDPIQQRLYQYRKYSDL